MAVEHDVLERLRELRSFDDCVELFHTLGFDYDGHAISTNDWPAALSGLVGDVRFAARHGDFAVIHVCLKTDRMIGAERQITARLLGTYPHSLLVFSDADMQLWHIVHVRYDEQAERRRQLRRFTVDTSDTRASSRLRTTAERLARLAVSKGESLSAPEVQRRCDAAFRISEVADDFLKQFRKVVADLTAAIGQQNQKVVTSEAESLRQAQVLLDRLVFLYFVQRKGWLNGEEDYLYSRFRTAYDGGRDDSTFYRETLLPLFRALSHPHAERLRDELGNEEAHSVSERRAVRATVPD